MNNLKILIAEDDELSFLYINIILKTISNNIVRAKDGNEVLEMLKKNRFDIALLDVNLPALSGIELAQIIQKEYPETGIIMNSAFSIEKDREDAFKKSNFIYLEKPLKKESVVAAIRKVYQKR